MHKKGENGNIMAESRNLKVRGIRRGSDRGRGEDAKHTPINCPETKKWQDGFVCNKWFIINEDKDHWQVFI
jgi:hypothetical protein